MLHRVLFQPDIPQNAGTLLRLRACLGLEAGLIEPAGFPASDRHFRQAGLDDPDALALRRHVSGDVDDRDMTDRPGDVLLVGRESAEVPPPVHEEADARRVMPVRPGFRSLDVAVAAAMAAGEALRQRRAAAVPSRDGVTGCRRAPALAGPWP